MEEKLTKEQQVAFCKKFAAELNKQYPVTGSTWQHKIRSKEDSCDHIEYVWLGTPDGMSISLLFDYDRHGAVLFLGEYPERQKWLNGHDLPERVNLSYDRPIEQIVRAVVSRFMQKYTEAFRACVERRDAHLSHQNAVTNAAKKLAANLPNAELDGRTEYPYCGYIAFKLYGSKLCKVECQRDSAKFEINVSTADAHKLALFLKALKDEAEPEKLSFGKPVKKGKRHGIR